MDRETQTGLTDSPTAGQRAGVRDAVPATHGEYIMIVSHYHRAEIARMAGWRDRIDRTTNWAITGVAAMLSLSLSTPSVHHGVLLFAMLLVLLLLFIEARRYRFFDVYRARVRLLERNYFAPAISGVMPTEDEWRLLLAEDLRNPNFLMSLGGAFSRRLRRNYAWMFLILLLAWILKISSAKLQETGMHRDAVTSAREIVANAALGPFPGWAVVVGVAVFYGWIVYLCLNPATKEGELSHGNAHV